MINILQQIVEKFIRTYFFNKRDEDYAYLLDQAVGLEGYNRVSNTAAVQLVEHASESSYGTSSLPEKRPSLHAALYSGDWQASARLIQQLKQDAKDDSDKKRIQEFSRYVKKCLRGLQNGYYPF